jgi:hypothetical protein
MNFEFGSEKIELTKVEIMVFGACLGAMLFIVSFVLYS